MSKALKVFLIVLVLAIIIVVVYFIFRTEEMIIENEEPEPIGGQTDKYGCLVAAGYSWCQAEERCLRVFEEFCPDQVDGLVEKIKNVSGVELLAGGQTTFNWIVHDETTNADKKIKGLIYQAEGVKLVDYDKLEKFANENYEQDNYNLADGVVGGQRGYLLNYAVCALNFRHAKMKTNEEGLAEPAGNNIIIKLECGYFNPNDVAKILLEQKIKEILAMKYEKPVDQVSIKTIKSIDSYFAGSVFFSQGEEGEGGQVLAMKKDGQWQVVYDGNGSIDCQKMREEYGFPNEILQPNFCD